ncbi:uncharacterized protein PHALS_05132 [Plasmopara halstedii]|uniref:Uncharacterized protein n=1 Tax=Plasmopara halstedii TaxID=4781 RepID=A0A0P1B0A7_PLAHL|nr:uncharacterized protein PHALS_05132 [Plasmopara halstedii]CEG47797.1 hypothetical protein PHALS_05132 [Plasmopara halstedii]|eukprot:XP_024584166.1 hypothetical protein PHALS_05132 [Plasmopara halstedii]
MLGFTGFRLLGIRLFIFRFEIFGGRNSSSEILSSQTNSTLRPTFSKTVKLGIMQRTFRKEIVDPFISIRAARDVCKEALDVPC